MTLNATFAVRVEGWVGWIDAVSTQSKFTGLSCHEKYSIFVGQSCGVIETKACLSRETRLVNGSARGSHVIKRIGL